MSTRKPETDATKAWVGWEEWKAEAYAAADPEWRALEKAKEQFRRKMRQVFARVRRENERRMKLGEKYHRNLMRTFDKPKRGATE